MHDPDRLLQLARDANAYTRDPLSTIERLERRDSIATSPVDKTDAKERLAFVRTSSVYYKDPTKQKRNVFKPKKELAALKNPDNWTFTKAERYVVLDQQIRNGDPAGKAQAVLNFDSNDPLDVNISYVANENGEAKPTGKSNGWLELVAGRNERNDVSYIRLLTSFGASQSSRDRALSIALERKALETAQELFRNDADPNVYGNADHFLAAIRSQDKRLITMFLTATNPLKKFYINQGLIEAVGGDSDLIALLIAHGADGMLNDGQALCAAISARNLEQTAMMLTNPYANFSTTSLDKATYTACDVGDENTKIRFLDILLTAGANANTSRVHDELLKAVKQNQTSLVELFNYHGTYPAAEGLQLAVSSGQIELVQIILQGPVPEASASSALDTANGLEDAENFEEIVRALVEKGVSQVSLNKCLAVSVDKGCSSLATTLIEKGATLDYDNGRCVREALKRNDFGLLGRLLEGPCQPSVLCGALPDAMKIQPPSERFDVMTRLLNKGVSGTELHIALQTIAANAKEPTDYGLIETLLKYKASVDFLDKNGNCVCTAAKQQDERALDLLCQGDPSAKTVSEAIGFLPVSFATAEAGEYEQQVRMISTLLEKGARGKSVAVLLIKAVRDDYREKARTVLIYWGANANYDHGKSIEEALRLPTISALEALCKSSRIERDSFVAQIPNALNPQGFSLAKAGLLARTSREYGYEGVLDQPLIDEVETYGARREVIELLLGLGASVDFRDGQSLRHAVSTGNVEVTHLLLGAGVNDANIALTFPVTSGIMDRPTRYDLMQVLLEAAKFDMGQDYALIQASHEAIQYDLSHVELLLGHQASANFSDGEAVIQSIQTKNLPLLKRFMLTGLNEKTLARAFALSRKIKVTKEERYDFFETLLEAYRDIDEISAALIEAVEHDALDIKTASLLLDHGASLEPKYGLAMQVVASGGSLELLNIFLSKGPSQTCRDAGFHSATGSSLSDEQRYSVYQRLLESGITQDLISASLLQATLADSIDHSLLDLLIDFNASLDFESGSALYGIAKKGDLPTLNILLRGNVSRQQTLDKSFSASIALKGFSNRLAIAKALLEKEPGVSTETVSHHLAQIVEESDHDLLSLLMNYKPDPAYNSGESLILSARAGDAKSMELLAQAEIPSDTVDRAFEELLDARAIQSKRDGSNGLQTAKILLEKGVSQYLVDRALLDGFDDIIGDLTKDLVELLIPYKPYVSGGDGKPFVDTAKAGNVELFRRLACQKPDMNIVVPALIQSIEKEEELIDFLEQLEECAERESDLHDFVIFTALEKFPKGHLLTEHLLDNGCPANSKIDAELDSSTGVQTLTLLIWALSRTSLEISEDVIMEILEDGHEAEVSFQTSVTHTSATILASTAGKNTVLKRLLELKVDLSLRDAGDRSALFYASRQGHLKTAEILIKAGATGNDGSLHEAAREAHPLLIELLLGKGHRDDFPSAIHAEGLFGRTPLEELCLNTRSGADDWVKRIHDSIALILPATVTKIPKSGGKTMLHLALDNKTSSVDVTRELLAFEAVWENINDPIYLFQDTQSGYVYSPTKYVELILDANNPDPEKSEQLVKLLHARKCSDRFYAHTVDQPLGCVGLPDEVAEAVNKQKRAEHEQREELKRRNEIAAQQRQIQKEEDERLRKLAKERHEELMTQIKKQEAAEKQAALDKQTLAVSHAQELERQRREALLNEASIRLQAVTEEATRRQAMATREQAAELSHRERLKEKELSALQSKVAYENQIASARERAAQTEYNLQVALCDKKDRSAEYQARQRQIAAHNY